MKKVLLAGVLVGLMAGGAKAMYVETLDIYTYSIGGTISWTHSYDFSEVPPYYQIDLSIVADDVDFGENDEVYLNDLFLGYLEQLPEYSNWSSHPGPGNPTQPLTTTVFALDASDLDFTMPLSVRVASSWGVEIETSTLTVRGSGHAVPDGGATAGLLGVALMGLAAFRRRMAA